MGYRRLGYTSYFEYLSSPWFRRVKKKAWDRSNKQCAICGKKWDLQPHHLLYESLGRWWEHFAIRYICSYHHEKVSFIFRYKVPNKWYYIISVYYIIKTIYIARHTPPFIARWIYYTYFPENVSREARLKKQHRRD